MNTQQYFADCITILDIKTRYRELCKLYHPDVSGTDGEVMKLVNIEYHRLLKSRDGSTYKTDSGHAEYRYDYTHESDVMQKLAELLALGLPGVEILLIGTWIWVTGDTKPSRQVLKEHGCKWHSKRECWFWSAKPWHGRSSNASLDELGTKYGMSRHSSHGVTVR